jgi:hypothetical protein
VTSTSSPKVRRTGRRSAVLLALAFGILVALAVPAAAHAGFASYSGFNYAPNPFGGIGDPAVTTAAHTPPYEAGSSVTMYVRAKAEPQPSWDPVVWSNVQIDITIPSGWTNAACGSAFLQINNPSTNNTNQPGGVAPGWTCSVNQVSGRSVVRFTGAALPEGALESDCAAFFSFTVTTPTPSVQTTYDGTAGTEGFIVDQTYADGNNSHWYPSADYQGTAPPGTQRSELSRGLVRTVAAYVAPTPTVPADPIAPAFTG